MNYTYVKGVKVDEMSKVSAIKNHVKEPLNYPKVQAGYENLSQVIFATQINDMFADLTKKMVELKKR